MATQPVFDKPVSVEEYLSMEFEHDCEYVDGVIEERDLGEFEHSYVQGLLTTLLTTSVGIGACTHCLNSGCRQRKLISEFPT
jgi:hypothetical protein